MSRTIAIAALALITVTALAGCGDDAPTADPTASASASGPNGTESSESSAPDVPANWQVASVEVAQLQVPPTWRLSSSGDLSLTARAPEDAIGISPGAATFQGGVHSGNGDDEAAVDALATLEEKTLANDVQDLKRLPNETINGSIFYHFQGDNGREWEDHYGTVVPAGEHRVAVTWRFTKADIDRKGAEALIGQIMPTYQVL
ncbi:hypothetical protein G5C66_06350 [Nocardioides sp. KC13]|uniref:Lipoprotein n=1 Tax=Nocardioides turkmenicus TaxID=2711220 RepID=A0A6M1QYE6_9ACTN|nr:hypothetical protein [Nocardioides sp. KC13]NGN92362.1 hypothetical protein [Nocardioides sp. KC13]